LTATSVLEQLRAAGLEVSRAGDKVRVRGGLPDDLRALAVAARAQLLADLAEEAAESHLYCPRCRMLDYVPLGSGRRRCFQCGEVWP
jgi:hypothetical protein